MAVEHMVTHDCPSVIDFEYRHGEEAAGLEHVRQVLDRLADTERITAALLEALKDIRGYAEALRSTFEAEAAVPVEGTLAADAYFQAMERADTAIALAEGSQP